MVQIIVSVSAIQFQKGFIEGEVFYLKIFVSQGKMVYIFVGSGNWHDIEGDWGVLPWFLWIQGKG